MDKADLSILRESVAEVLAENCDSAALHSFLDGRLPLDQKLWGLAADLGWLAICPNEELGGLGAGVRGLELLARELGACAAPGSFLPTLVILQWLATSDPDAEAQSLLAEMMQGVTGAALAINPEQRGTMVATKLFGEGIRLLAGDNATFAALVVGDDEVALFQLDQPGISLENETSWDPTRPVARLSCDGAEIVTLIRGEQAVRSLLNLTALAVAADSLGGSREILARTVAYMKERHQFGRPIASFQALKHRVADLAVLITTAEQLVETSTEALAGGRADAALWSSIAKAEAVATYAKAAEDCLLLHGGVGYTWEFDPHVYVRRARLNNLICGTEAKMRDGAIRMLEELVA